MSNLARQILTHSILLNKVNPSDVGMYDRIVIQELIKTVASAQQLNSEGQREFKVVVLNEVDRLTKDAQHALRRTMEKYMNTCRIFLVTNSTSKVKKSQFLSYILNSLAAKNRGDS